ncbi:calcium-binding protein [Aquabacterium sp.]|uniref:calcium-binding protein n=1 Tax=Aquabacterium sp. TaxID=1872578 RepID=UPI002489D1C3|nr:calcium-binding protein [Aquabacterium sp.]MDI1258086.1 calcium-binding protein [Aquabacterium sp.]
MQSSAIARAEDVSPSDPAPRHPQQPWQALCLLARLHHIAADPDTLMHEQGHHQPTLAAPRRQQPGTVRHRHNDKFTINNWYANAANQVESVKLSDGKTLTPSNVDNLVNAMASFTPPALGQTTLPANYQTALNPVIAANWA